MAKKTNGYIKKVGVGLAIAGIIWNAAILHNDVKHINKDIQEIKVDIQDIKTYLLTERSKE